MFVWFAELPCWNYPACKVKSSWFTIISWLYLCQETRYLSWLLNDDYEVSNACDVVRRVKTKADILYCNMISLLLPPVTTHTHTMWPPRGTNYRLSKQSVYLLQQFTSSFICHPIKFLWFQTKSFSKPLGIYFFYHVSQAWDCNIFQSISWL